MSALPSQPLVCAPLLLEARALRAALGAGPVVRTGAGCRRSARSAARLTAREFGALAVAGLGGGVGTGVRSGDVVVADELRGPSRTVPVTGAAVLVDELRRCGLTVHRGPILTTDHLVLGGERRELSRSDVLAVDTESAVLASAAGPRPVIAVRVVVDTAEQPLLDRGTPLRAVAALRALRRVPVPLARWASSVTSSDVADADRPRTRREESSWVSHFARQSESAATCSSRSSPGARSSR